MLPYMNDELPEKPSTTIQCGSVVFHEIVNQHSTIKSLLALADQMQSMLPETTTPLPQLTPYQQSAHQRAREALAASLNLAFTMKPFKGIEAFGDVKSDKVKRELTFLDGIHNITELLRDNAEVADIVQSLSALRQDSIPLSEAEYSLLHTIDSMEHAWISAGVEKNQAKQLAAGEVEAITLAIVDREQGIADYIKLREHEYDLLGKVKYELYRENSQSAQKEGGRDDR